METVHNTNIKLCFLKLQHLQKNVIFFTLSLTLTNKFSDFLLTKRNSKIQSYRKSKLHHMFFTNCSSTEPPYLHHRGNKTRESSWALDKAPASRRLRNQRRWSIPKLLNSFVNEYPRDRSTWTETLRFRWTFRPILYPLRWNSSWWYVTRLGARPGRIYHPHGTRCVRLLRWLCLHGRERRQRLWYYVYTLLCLWWFWRRRLRVSFGWWEAQRWRRRFLLTSRSRRRCLRLWEILSWGYGGGRWWLDGCSLYRIGPNHFWERSCRGQRWSSSPRCTHCPKSLHKRKH